MDVRLNKRACKREGASFAGLGYFIKLQRQFNDVASTGLCVQHVHGTAQSGVEGTYETSHIYRVLHIRDWHADQGLLNGAALSHIIHGVGVPDGG